MKTYLSAVIIFLTVGIITLLARSYGWYHEYWFTDVALHTLSGVGFGCVWLGITAKSSLSKIPIFLSVISFAAFGSILWEFWEFFGWHITPSHTRFYIPELGDTLNDIFCGIIGGAFLSLKRFLYK